MPNPPLGLGPLAAELPAIGPAAQWSEPAPRLGLEQRLIDAPRGTLRCLHYDEAIANFPRAWRNGRRSGLKQA